MPESAWVGAGVPPGSMSPPPEVGVVGWVTIFTVVVESSLGAGVDGGGVVTAGVSTGVVSVGGTGWAAVVVVGAVVVSTGVVGVAGGWALGSWVDSVVTSVTGWATGLGGSGAGMAVVATEVVSGRLVGSFGEPAGLVFLARRRLWAVARPAPAATEADTLTGWETEWVTTGALLWPAEATVARLAA